MPPGPAFKNTPTAGPASPRFGADGSDLVFARFAAMLRGSKELHGCTILAWDDPSVDQSPPGTDGPPWARLTPMPGQSKIHCRTKAGVAHRMPLVVSIETSTPGADVLQSQKFWGAILRAVFPGEAIDAQLQALGVSRIAVEQAGWGPPRAATPERPDGGRRCEGSGKLELLMHFTTPE